MRKNTQLLIAYTTLFASAIGALCHDAKWRASQPIVFSEAEKKAALRREKGLSTTRVAPIAEEPAPAAVASKKPDDAAQLPRGVFLLKEPTTVRTTDGPIRQLSAGTQVMLVRREDGKMKVTHEGVDFFVEDGQVTRNMKAIEKLLAARKD